MMKIILMSDSHGKDENVVAVLDREMPVDAVMHMGDSQEDEEEFRLHFMGEEIELYMVAGNCDYFADFPPVRIITLEGHRIFMAHGHGYYVNFGTKDLKAAALANGCDIALYGHTHRPVIDDKDKEILILNPGSVSFPRQENHRASYMVMELERGRRPEVALKYVDEL